MGAFGATAGPERIQLPAWYGNDFVFLTSVDKRGREQPIIRFIYIDTTAATTARRGAPLRQGTKIVMVERLGRTDATGQPLRNREGRFLASDEIFQILVGEKRAGWGDTYAEQDRVGDWEFAVFAPDGALVPDVDYQACRECHQQAVTTDFTFSVFPSLAAVLR